MLRALSMAFVLLASSSSWAWGERGHHVICEVATQLVQTPEMKAFLLTRSEVMGHLCNIPDIYWRDLGEASKIGDAAHFINPENVGLRLETVPEAIKDYYAHDHHAEDTTIEKKHTRMGSLFWRAQQFYDRAVTSGKAAKNSTPPAKSEEQKADHAFNKNILSFLTNLGLIGHFVGDASMPFHTNSDYDGWAAGHGGIHAFYEGACVASYDFALENEVFQKARRLGSKRARVPVVNTAWELTRQVALASSPEVPRVLEADRILSSSVSSEDRSQSKPAERASLEKACPAFRSMIVTQMARSALALARTWDAAFADATQPDLKKYRSYKYPLMPEFVRPDYLLNLGE